MGSSGPLDHPELRDVEALLDHADVSEAQRRLAPLGPRNDLREGVTYLTTRLLHARGKLDASGVVDRLRELLARSPDFPEARALLDRASSGDLLPPERVLPSIVAPPMESAPAMETVRTSPRAPGPGSLPPDEAAEESSNPPTWSEPLGASGTARRDSAVPESRPSRRPGFSPIVGLDTYVERTSSERPRSSQASDRPRTRLPDIPRAPALPQFRDNPAPPSYAPKRVVDVEPRKSLLPRDAGRYSAAPNSTDILDRRSHRPSKPPSTFPPAGGRRTVPGVPERIQRSPTPSRSVPPNRTPNPLPSLFEIATWIDAGRSRDAIAAINRAGPNAGPGYAVLRARALAAAGYVEQALDAIDRIEASYALDPELCAACARLLVELGNPARGLVMATRAFDADPNRPLVRMTYALTAIRTARRNMDDVLVDRADQALEPLQGREGPLPSLFQALRACVEARTGDPERAISSAQRALGLDSSSPDALAATAEALARLGRVDEARHAWNRLYEVAPAEAEALVPAFGRSGVGLTHSVVAASAIGPRPSVWRSVEVGLATGDPTPSQIFVEKAANDVVRRMVKPASQSGFTAIASVAATFLTTTPILASFAPFDLSLYGVLRVEAALDVLYGREPRGSVASDDSGLILLLGTYLGESLRLAHRGKWEGNSIELEGMRVTTPDTHWFPFRSVAARIRQGGRGSLRHALESALSREAPAVWKIRSPSPAAPPTPWDPRPWPAPSHIGTIGRSLSESPIGRYCENFAEGPLDNTTSSLIALDSYLNLVAPRDAPVDADSPWTRKLSVLAGAYVGETLRELVGGEWIYGVDDAQDALAFKLRLRGTVETMPVAHVLERIVGERSSSLVDYAKTMMRRAGRT